eukprot:TRINITY_DN6675_c0_g1_i1.p1 TRINITY_DN6675_c0_g1~~TRINITY_DN6675_c0_g1_i1.p1  ORF type:complete len:103 (-),score=6.27 TRINITY_DN6675_c0_g1_i1:259-543(-)
MASFKQKGRRAAKGNECPSQSTDHEESALRLICRLSVSEHSGGSDGRPIEKDTCETASPAFGCHRWYLVGSYLRNRCALYDRAMGLDKATAFKI